MLNSGMPQARLEKSKKYEKVKKIFGAVSIAMIVLLGAVAILIWRSLCWVLQTWDNLTMEEIVYHLTMPMEGTNSDMIGSYIVYCVVVTVIVVAALVAALSIMKYKRKRKAFRITKASVGISAVLTIVCSVLYFWEAFDVSAYVKNQNTYSSFIDDNYVDPSSVNLTFPEQKRNLIYIFLESMENTYADVESGGAFEKNVISELTELSMENENFSGEDSTLNGAYVTLGATWTMGAMFAQTSGLPLTIPIGDNSMSSQDDFFPGIITIGDILDQEGYQQELVIGSDAVFGGRKLYFEQHGDYQIYDYNYSLENGEIPEGYYVWWGYEDEILFENAKTRLNELAASGEPFNFTMLTVDTHFEDGYVCSLCEDTYNDQYSNVMACSSRQVSEFVEWIQQQPFYENTTIVISGDHLTMDSDYCQDVDSDYERKVYTTYINSAVMPETDNYREYTTLDAFPTTLASLGVEIEGNRLGLGVNLFSLESTLLEKYGLEEVDTGLAQKSALMDELWTGINRATVSDVEYDSAQQTAILTVSDIQWDTEIASIRCSAWTDAEQQDLKWYNGEQQSDGEYIVRIPLNDFGEIAESYSFAVYLETSDGERNQIGSKTLEMDNNIAEEEQTEEMTVSAYVTTIPYDFRTGKFEIQVSGVTGVENLASIQCAVWADENQEDLKWYTAEVHEDGSYITEVFASDYYFKEADYFVLVYATDSTGQMYFLGACQETISS